VFRRHDDRTLMALIELKTPRGRLNPDQEGVIAELAGLGITVHVCRTLQIRDRSDPGRIGYSRFPTLQKCTEIIAERITLDTKVPRLDNIVQL
jgi:hypothetical protein